MNDRPLCIAKIVGNEGSGEYTITQQWWNADVGDYVEAGPPNSERAGLYEAAARDWQNRPGGRHGDLVKVWRMPIIGGSTQLVIDVPEKMYARAVKPAVRTMDDCAWINPGPATTPYVYGWPCDADGNWDVAPPDLTGATAWAFHMIMDRVRDRLCGQQMSIREGDILPHTYEGSTYRLGDGPWHDRPIWTQTEWGSDDNVRPGWLLMDKPSALSVTVYHPNPDVDTLGDRLVLPFPVTYDFDLRQHTPIGAGDHPTLPGAGVGLWQREAFPLETTSASPPPAGIAYVGINRVLRYS